MLLHCFVHLREEKNRLLTFCVPTTQPQYHAFCSSFLWLRNYVINKGSLCLCNLMLSTGQVLMSKCRKLPNPLSDKKVPQRGHHQISPLQLHLQYASSPENPLPILGLLPVMMEWWGKPIPCSEKKSWKCLFILLMWPWHVFPPVPTLLIISTTWKKILQLRKVFLIGTCSCTQTGPG